MSTFIKDILLLVGGPFVGYLVATHQISIACTNDVVTSYSVLLGSFITISSLALGVYHSVAHAKIVAENTLEKTPVIETPTTTQPAQPVQSVQQ